MKDRVDQCSLHSILYTFSPNAKPVSSPGVMILNDRHHYVFVPKHGRVPGLILGATSNQLAAELYGEYHSVVKNGVVDYPCVVLRYAPLFLHYAVYVPEVTTLSVKSLGFRSLGIQPDHRRTLCSHCHTTLSKQCRMSSIRRIWCSTSTVPSSISRRTSLRRIVR